MFTDRIQRITPSATLQMTAKAAELRAAGIDVVNLSVGEPDFPTPANIQNAGVFAIQNGYTHYTAGGGMPELKQAICTKLERDNKLEYRPDQVMASCGGKHVLYNICQTLFQSGNQVIIFNPYWVSFPEFVAVTGAEPVLVDTDPEQQFEPVMADLQQKMNSSVKGMIINTPSNPTGGVWRDEVISQVLDLANKNELWVISDECYEQFVYDRPFTSLANLTADPGKIITVQSCSKTYSMTGWRLGYGAGDPDLIKAMTKLQGQSTSCPSSIAQYAAIEALTGDQSSVKMMRDTFLLRRDLVINGLNNIDGLQCRTPGGAFYAFPDVTDLFGKKAGDRIINTPRDVSMYLLEEVHVVTVSGESFGSNAHIRLSYAVSDEDLKKALDRIKSALANLA